MNHRSKEWRIKTSTICSIAAWNYTKRKIVKHFFVDNSVSAPIDRLLDDQFHRPLTETLHHLITTGLIFWTNRPKSKQPKRGINARQEELGRGRGNSINSNGHFRMRGSHPFWKISPKMEPQSNGGTFYDTLPDHIA